MTEQHFEILADCGRGWSTHAVVDDREEAEARSKVIKDEAKAFSVKVNCVEFNDDTGGFKETEVLFIGDRLPDPPKDGEVDGGENCTKGDEYYGSSSRRLIRRVLGKWLDSLSITPTELLHHAEHMKRLDNAGTTLQGGVQQVARIQVRLTGENVQARQKQLYDIGDGLYRDMVLRWRDKPPPALENEDVDALAKKLDGNSEAQLLFLCAVSEYLRPIKTISDKMYAVLALMAKSKSLQAIAYLDGLFADFVDSPVFLRSIIGDDQELGGATIAAIHLLKGEGGENFKPEFKPFLDYIGSDKLPQCHATLLHKIESTLASNRSFLDGAPLREGEMFKKIHKLLALPKGEFIGGFHMQDAFHSRSDRLVTPTAISRLLEGHEEADQRVNLILQLSECIFGDNNIRRLGEHLLAIIRQPAYTSSWMQKKEAPAKKMRALVELQKRIGETSLNSRQKTLGGKQIDEICLEVMKEGQVLQRVTSSAGSPVAAGMALLRLYSTGIFTKGQSHKAARTHVVGILRSNDFMTALLAPADNAEEKKEMLSELSNLLQQSDLPETPLSAALQAAIN